MGKKWGRQYLPRKIPARAKDKGFLVLGRNGAEVLPIAVLKNKVLLPH
jgi:hypothetical protein